MITDVRIEGLRGIREGELTGLGPLVVLVGPNGCGKSTILDAINVGSSAQAGTALGQMVQRRPRSIGGARWVFRRPQPPVPATVRVKGHHKEAATIVSWLDGPGRHGKFHAVFGDESTSIVRVDRGKDGNGFQDVAFTQDNRYTVDGFPLDEVDDVRLVDPTSLASHGGGEHQRPVEDDYSDAVQAGRKGVADDALRTVLGRGVRGVTLLTDRGVPVLHIEYEDGSVPVALAGDGVAALVRIALELAGRPGGTVLIEEPEAHQHPRLVAQTAKVIWATVTRGVQVVLTTHSLELIDLLLAAAPPERLDDLAVYRLKLDDGLLLHTRLSGSEVEQRRGDFEDDLR